ncbi:MAG TPA: molybdopterin converting factor subunit 1 [Candidatus Dormibacteraeota bacterium]|nr:molybdopterin converting factor subunit 1 [Candidatus Dormibacteraeota bacterium]
MTIRVLAFARARELMGSGESTIELPEGATVAQLRAHLSERVPQLAGLGGSLRFARNGALAAEDQSLHDGDEVALLPPVSGG